MYSCDCRVSILEADDLDAGLLDQRERFTAEGTENPRRAQRQGLGDGVKIPSLSTERGRLGHPACEGPSPGLNTTERRALVHGAEVLVVPGQGFLDQFVTGNVVAGVVDQMLLLILLRSE